MTHLGIPTPKKLHNFVWKSSVIIILLEINLKILYIESSSIELVIEFEKSQKSKNRSEYA
jgi:hypothetical protein